MFYNNMIISLNGAEMSRCPMTTGRASDNPRGVAGSMPGLPQVTSKRAAEYVISEPTSSRGCRFVGRQAVVLSGISKSTLFAAMNAFRMGKNTSFFSR